MVDVDQMGWRFYPQFHQVEQIGPAGDKFRGRAIGRHGNRLGMLAGRA